MSVRWQICFLRDRGGVTGARMALPYSRLKVDPYNLALVIGAVEDKSCEGELGYFL
jgi:hypothetical protein